MSPLLTVVWRVRRGYIVGAVCVYRPICSCYIRKHPWPSSSQSCDSEAAAGGIVPYIIIQLERARRGAIRRCVGFKGYHVDSNVQNALLLPAYELVTCRKPVDDREMLAARVMHDEPIVGSCAILGRA
jgi:hypothetical protein